MPNHEPPSKAQKQQLLKAACAGCYLQQCVLRVLLPARNRGLSAFSGLLPIDPEVVPFWASYLEFYKVHPKRNYLGPMGRLGAAGSAKGFRVKPGLRVQALGLPIGPKVVPFRDSLIEF